MWCIFCLLWRSTKIPQPSRYFCCDFTAILNEVVFNLKMAIDKQIICCIITMWNQENLWITYVIVCNTSTVPNQKWNFYIMKIMFQKCNFCSSKLAKKSNFWQFYIGSTVFDIDYVIQSTRRGFASKLNGWKARLSTLRLSLIIYHFGFIQAWCIPSFSHV